MPADRSSFGSISLVVFDQAITSGASFVTSIIIARACSQHEFGLYILGLTLVTLLLTVQEAAIANPYMVYGPRMRGRLPAYAGSVLVHQAVLSLLAIMGLTLAAGAVANGIGPEGLSWVLLALIPAVPLILMKELARRLSFANRNHGTALLVDTAAAVLQIGGLVALAVSASLSPALAVMVWGVASAVGVAIYAMRSWRSIAFRYRRTLPHFIRNWRLARWTLPSALIWAVSEYLYPWTIAALRNASDVGVFGACLGVASMPNVVLFGLTNYIGPAIMHAHATGGRDAMRRYVWKATALHTGAVAAPGVLIGIFGGTLVTWIYGDVYAGNGATVFVLLTGVAFAALSYSPSRALFVLGRADIDLAVNVGTLVVFLTAGVWLVWLLGPFGAALGLLLRGALGAALRVLVFVRIARPATPIPGP